MLCLFVNSGGVKQEPLPPVPPEHPPGRGGVESAPDGKGWVQTEPSQTGSTQ